MNGAIPRPAMVLAAGLGKRMRPVTDTMPKPLVRIAGKPLLDWGLDALARAGVPHAVVNMHYLGSQIAATAAGAIKGAQALDYCAGGGGKTLALAAMMENTGQLYAYDRDARRLKPLYDRAKRAGVRNLQIRSPAGGEGLDDLEGKMDVVFVDAPCTGAGTWRRHPDTKWRLTEKQLETRMGEQDAVLEEASRYVKPGGRIVWVTCSFLMEENEDRLAAFLETHPSFARAPALELMKQSGLLTGEGEAALKNCVTPEGAIRLTPDKIRADGFFVAVLSA